MTLAPGSDSPGWTAAQTAPEDQRGPSDLQLGRRSSEPTRFRRRAPLSLARLGSARSTGRERFGEQRN
eukprot:12640277-Alexandrium_andersonii.AAC.1